MQRTLKGSNRAIIQDGAVLGVALARYFTWLEKQLKNGVVLDESQGADQLEKFRSCVRPLLCVWIRDS
jgi:Xaa-Pro aminopeptidase